MIINIIEFLYPLGFNVIEKDTLLLLLHCENNYIKVYNFQTKIYRILQFGLSNRFKKILYIKTLFLFIQSKHSSYY